MALAVLFSGLKHFREAEELLCQALAGFEIISGQYSLDWLRCQESLAIDHLSTRLFNAPCTGRGHALHGTQAPNPESMLLDISCLHQKTRYATCQENTS